MPLDRKLIYLVDDDESVCRALKSFLVTFGLDVMTFNSAKNFFDSVSKYTASCLVLDIHMPGMDGWEAQERIVASGSKLPIIFISAGKEENVAARALKAGVVGFLQKPFDGQALVDLINLGTG